MTAAFRHQCSGQVVETGRFHDVSCLPAGEEAELGEWDAAAAGAPVSK